MGIDYRFEFGQNGPLPSIVEIFCPKTLFGKIYSNLPLYVVLELGELEYPILLFHRGTMTWHLELKKLVANPRYAGKCFI